MHSQQKRVPIIGSMVIIFTALFVSGCQTWPNANFPLQNATRVPPPGTGTYQLPSGYYNNNSTSALPISGQVLQANATSGLRTPNGQLPTTNLASANNSVTNAGYTTTNFAASTPVAASPNAPTFKAAGSGSVTSAAAGTPSETWENPSQMASKDSGAGSNTYEPSPNAASASLSDSPDSIPSLQWQQY